MHKLAAWIMAARWQAVTAVVGFAVLGFIVQPVALLSGAALVLVALRLGAASALHVLGLSLVAMALLSLVATGSPWLGLVSAGLQWGPLLALALIWRRSISLANTLHVATVAGVAAVLVAHALVDDLAGGWLALLDEYLRPMLARLELPSGEIDAYLTRLAGVMTGALAASVLLGLIMSLLLGRWWQALLYNPGGFRQELTALRLGQPAALAALAVAALAIVTEAPLLVEVALVVAVTFLLQGLALVHELSARTASPTVWLVGAYALLVLALPQMAAALAAMGAIDAFADFRARLGPGRGA